MNTLTPDDPLYANQWHFDLLGDIETIWAEYSGVGVNVGVFDDGMDIDHEDLVENYDASLQLVVGFDFDVVDGLNNSDNDPHGTSVGGLIAAANNGIGGVGVAWGATISSVDFLNDAFNEGFIFEAIAHMGTFDIVNQSYGYDPDFAAWQSLANPGSYGFAEAMNLYDAALSGRDGLGTVMVKAVGNASNNATLQSLGINGNAQGESGNSLHFIVTVAALESDGFVASYSSYGANVLVSAGAGAVTTDLTGAAGYNSSNYTSTFGGTSAATPVTAGVIALMLEANPNLTVPQIQMILAVSAAQTGSEFGSFGQGYEVAEWISVGDGTWNGGGLTYNPSYGYGAVDAFAAVRIAEFWGDLSFLEYGSFDDQITVEVIESVFTTIADFSTTDVVIQVTDGVVIDHLYVTIEMEHTWSADLDIQLITPDGDVFDLMMDDASSNAFGDWTFGVAALRGQDSVGDWTVRISDDQGGDTGFLEAVTLNFIGMEDFNDDIWHFTDDYLDLAAVEGDRRVIGDDGGDGGVNVINLVAVSGDVSATLGDGGTLRVDNAYWATIETDAISGIVLGDGDDRVTGSDEQDGILAGRGDDLVMGGAGADGLQGQQGNDVLFGDSNGGYGTLESAQIFRLFNSVFGREPAQGGHQNWMNQLLTENMTLDEVAELFIASPEFELTYGTATDIEFVNLLFQNILGRPPAQTGLDAWVANIDGGMTRAEVVRNLSESAENIIITRDTLQTFEEDNDATIYAPRVYRLFEAIFGREPNPEGFEAWLNNFENGLGFEEAITIFMASAEFNALYAGTDNEGFIETLFQNVLGRPPAQSGLDAWTANLDNGMMREAVVELFVDGAEFLIRTADSLNEFMLALGNGDQIDGGAGDNILSGGAYADTFVFNGDDMSTAVVLDLEQWDVILLTNFGISDADEAIANMTQAGSDVVFSMVALNGELTTVTFRDTELDDINGAQISYNDGIF